MIHLLHKLLGRLSVGRKLLLIFLLDMTAVAYVSGIMINEKYLAIDFARKELAGHAYIAAVRGPLLAVGEGNAAAGPDSAGAQTPAAGAPHESGAWLRHASAVEAAERQYGVGMGSAEAAQQFVAQLRTLARHESPSHDLRAAALDAGRALVTRVGNQSNLILDPDLDSYYTMSIVVLRLPELLDVSHALGVQVRENLRAAAAAAVGTQPVTEARGRYLILEGRLDAVVQGMASDYSEAYAAASHPELRPALEPGSVALLAAVKRLRAAAHSAMDGHDLGASSAQQADPAVAAWLRVFGSAQQELLTTLDRTWGQADEQLAGLLRARIDASFTRMWQHLGTAVGLLVLILSAVFFVAQQIARPLKQLSGVMDAVASTGDHQLRAEWDSRDEIGRLVRGFNDMLAQLDAERALQQELAASARAAQAQRELVEALPIPLVVTSVPDHRVLHANRPAQQWLGDHLDNPWRSQLDAAVRVRFFQQLADREAVDEFEVRWGKGPEASWAVLSARRVSYQGRDAVLTAFTPVNQRKQMERRLEVSAKVFEASSEGILIIDAQHTVLSANRAFCHSTSHDLYDLQGEAPAFFDSGDGPDRFLERLWPVADLRGSWQGEVNVRRRDGRSYPAWLLVSAVRDNDGEGRSGASHYIATVIDMTERKRHEERIRFLARHDVLTELPNRSLCLERLREAVAAAAAGGARVGVLFIDLDRFKNINDSLGHHVGDGLLRSVAMRLVDAVRASDTVCRLGGDEFVVILREVQDADEVAELVHERLVPRIRAAHDVGGAELHVSCSVGVALYPDHATDIDTLMRHADAAMYQAKASGRDGVCLFTPEINELAQERLRIESALRHAVERNELQLVVQPRVDARTHAVVGVEALLRWHNPELGVVAPARFIPIAEETGLIVDIGHWVIDAACALQSRWRGIGLGHLPVAINVSALQLRDGTLPQRLGHAMQAHGVGAGALEVELTESTLMDSVEDTLRQLRMIKALGVTLAIDDFGTGYSSLHYLNRFPIDRLKVDRSFVRAMLDSAADLAIARAVIGLGHTLGMQVVAEGVEHEAQAQALKGFDCDELQGYLYARPMPPDAFVAWLGRRIGDTVLIDAAALAA